MPSLPQTDDSDLAKQLWAIGDAVRISILRRLPHQANCEGGYNVSKLAQELGLSQPTISHHLRVLRQAGIVSNRKMCRDVFYFVDRAACERVTSDLMEILGRSDDFDEPSI